MIGGRDDGGTGEGEEMDVAARRKARMPLFEEQLIELSREGDENAARHRPKKRRDATIVFLVIVVDAVAFGLSIGVGRVWEVIIAAVFGASTLLLMAVLIPAVRAIMRETIENPRSSSIIERQNWSLRSPVKVVRVDKDDTHAHHHAT